MVIIINHLKPAQGHFEGDDLAELYAYGLSP